MKVHQIANGAIYYGEDGEWEPLHDAKLEALADIIEEAAGMPVIVAYTFKSDLIRLKKAFPQGRAFDTKPKTEAAFKAGEIPILFIHPASGGHGVDGFQNVTNIIVFFSVDWNYEYHAQLIARAGAVRQLQAGFKRPVFIHQIIAKDTVDEDILNRLESKMTIENALKRGLAKRGLK
jgi:SNF2 family DNA or RNA helicase